MLQQLNQVYAPEYMFDTLALLCGGFLGLTTVEAIFAKKKNPEPKKDGE
jgi:hypothetical protein